MKTYLVALDGPSLAVDTTAHPKASADPPGFRIEHVCLDRQFDQLIRYATTGDWPDCEALWDAFRRDLEQHMAYEERHLFPAYAETGPRAAQLVQQLRVEHYRLRQQQEALGADLKLHIFRAGVLRNLVGVLREHALREGQYLYPWIELQTAPVESTPGSDEATI